MSKYVNLEQWQMDNLSISTKGKKVSGRDKFNNGPQDFSAKINLRNHVKFKPLKKELVVNSTKKKRGFPTIFQYLKNTGYNKTYIQIDSEPRLVGKHLVSSQVITFERFLFDNQVKKMYPNVTAWWYENTQEDIMSSFFTKSQAQ
jgi:hypothetical protein